MSARTCWSLLFLPILIRAQTCYFPDGTPSTEQAADWSPCDPNASISACCESTHVCLSNGLCLDTVFNHVVRGACTDSTFSSYFCPQYCQDYAPNTLSDLRQCNGGNSDWTCGLDASSCDSPFSVPSGQVRDYRRNDAIIAAGPASSASASSSLATTASSTSAVSTSSDTASAQSTSASTPSASSSSSKSTSATTVGLGAGLGVGLPLLIALLAALFFLFRARKEVRTLKAQRHGEPGVGAAAGGYGDHASQQQTGWAQEPKSPAPQYQTPTQSAHQAPQQQIWEAPNRTDGLSRPELPS